MDSIETLVNEIICLENKNEFIEIEIRNLEVISESKEYHFFRIYSSRKNRCNCSIDGIYRQDERLL